MIRSVWFYFSAVVLTLWHGGIVIVAGLLGIKHGKSKVYDNTMHRWGRRVLRASGVRYSLVGMDNIPDGPVVFISNHQSMFDIFLLATAFPHDTRFVAKKELMKIPVFGRALVGAGNITIDRHNRQAAFSAYDEAAKAVRGGMRAIVFGEGTRSLTGELLPFKKAPAVLAIAANATVVPVYCAGTFEVMAKGQFKLVRTPIALMCGKPIATEGMGYEDRERLMEQVERAIREMRDAWGR